MALLKSTRYVVIGAGVHGLSSAWHLAQELEKSGTGSGADVIVLDKGGVGAGASGIACGVVRNNYFQPAMRELMAHSVSVWESDPEAFSYHPVGYMQIGPDAMAADVAQIYEEQRAIGYPSTLVTGAGDCAVYMEQLFSDWQAKAISCVLHEKRGGYANATQSMIGLAAKATAAGVTIFPGVTVTGLASDGTAITAVETDQGTVECDQVVIAAGPWVRNFWAMLELPEVIQVKGSDGSMRDVPMWVYWCLQEGTVKVAPDFLLTNAGEMPPVIHVDTDAPLYDDMDGSLVTDEMWGIYYKPDFSFGGVQGGAMPYVVDRPAAQVDVDPYGKDSTEFALGEDFERMWTSALAHCHKRFEHKRPDYVKSSFGGLGCFTPDSFPVIDTYRENVHVIADSNHGYKMIGVGALVAKEVLGSPQALLEPFRFSRYAEGRLHPVSHSPYPWS